jgi:hypothetical protein
MASMATPAPGSLGVLPDQFLGIRTACGPMHTAQAILR